MKRNVTLGSLILAFVVFLFLIAARRGSPEIAVERDLVYGRVGDAELKLDLAMPKAGRGPFPAIVFLHGRGWREGNRRDMSHFIEGVGRMGYVGVTVEYRLVPAARFPAPVEDSKAAVRWLRANAGKYRIRPDRIGVVGFSAGGHLACMLGVTDKEDGLEGTGGNADQPSRVQAVVSFFGPTDFSTRDWPRDLEKEVIVPFLGESFADRPDVYKRASPITYVTKDAPPFLFFHGTEDELVPVDQSKRLAQKLKSFGVSVQLVLLEGERHGFTDAKNQESMKKMLDFLAERLKR
ncbi:MAG: alpha/beta hydrolase [Thermoanaerobaculia bacterium]|nr:alpha/beta hydrolase [Thermoanaerobaculia bacterium]